MARAAQVSAATVSYVLNNVTNQTISATTREAVLRAADELGYRPNLAARNLAFGISGVVLYIIPRVALGGLAVWIASELTSALAKRGVIMSVQFETDDAGGIREALSNLHPIAVCSSLPLGRQAVAAVTATGIPLLKFDGEEGRDVGGRALYRAVSDAQVAHLIGRGHRRLAFASSDIEELEPLNELRLSSMRAACEAQGLPEPAVDVFATDGSNAAGIVENWTSRGITGVCAYNDETALVVLHGVRAAGLKCPDDLAVIGIDANPIGYVTEPALTTVGFDRQRIVELSVAGLLDALGYPSEQQTPFEAPVVEVIQRAST